MVVSTPSLTSKPPSSTQTSTQRYGGTNKIQRFQRRGKTLKTQAKGTGKGIGSSSLRSSSTSSSSGRSSSFGSKSTPKPKGSGKVPGLGSLGVGINAKGDIDLGVYGGGVGAAVSAKGDVSLGLGVASVTWNFRNPNESALGFGFNTLTITGEQEGCQIILSYRILGQIVNQESRVADECSGSEHDIKRPKGEPKPPNPNPDPRQSNPNSDPATPPKQIFIKAGYYAIMYSSPSELGRDVNIQEQLEILKSFYRLSESNIEAIQDYITYYNFVGSYFFPRDGYVETFYNRSTSTVASDGYPIFWNGERLIDNTASNGFTVRDLNGNSMRCSSPVEGLVFPFRSYPQSELYLDTQAIPKRANLEEYTWSVIPLVPVIAKPKHETKPRGLKLMEDEQEICYRVYEMLGGDTFYYKGLMVDNSMFIPGGQGMFRMKTYNEIMNIIFRTFSHRTVGEIEFTITDTNKGAKGNQAVQIKTVNAQGYFTNLMKTLVESKNENTDQLNILVRLGLITSQLMKVLVITSENIKSIIGYLGVPQKDSLEKVDIPFDLSLNGQLTKGFSTREDLQKELLKIVDKDTEEAIEGILDKFLDEWQMPVKVRKLRSSREGGDFWFWLRQNLPK